LKNPRMQEAQRVLSDEDSFATEMVMILIDSYGTEFLNWLPETVKREIQEDFRLIPPKSCMDKIHALTSILTSNIFMQSVKSFIHICNALSAPPPVNFVVFDPADSEECAWGILEAAINTMPPGSRIDSDLQINIVRGPMEERVFEMPFSDEIRGYVSHVFTRQGILYPPGFLKEVAIYVQPDDEPGALSEETDPVIGGAIMQMKYEESQELKKSLVEKLADLNARVERLSGLLRINQAAART